VLGPTPVMELPLIVAFWPAPLMRIPFLLKSWMLLP